MSVRWLAGLYNSLIYGLLDHHNNLVIMVVRCKPRTSHNGVFSLIPLFPFPAALCMVAGARCMVAGAHVYHQFYYFFDTRVQIIRLACFAHEPNACYPLPSLLLHSFSSHSE